MRRFGIVLNISKYQQYEVTVMTQLAVHIGAELLIAWLVTLALAGISGWLLHGCIIDARPRRRPKKEESK